jgi:CDP-6-deoxy-D-xylo-4-hexulose-3-dehydrase
MNEDVNVQIENLINNLGKDFNTLKYVYNKNKFIPGETPVYYSGPYWDSQEITEAIKSLILGSWLSAGENVDLFEKLFSIKFNQRHSVMVNSGSSANLLLIAALKKVFNWKDNDEIILSVVGFPTTLSAIIVNKLKPTFVDIEFDTLNFDLSLIEKKITPKTKAIFLSPVLGNSCDIDFLLNICNKHNIMLVLDNCDSLGSKWDGKYLNEYASASSCSFYPAHHITTGEGGMVSSNNYEIVKTARSLAWWGRDCSCVGSQNIVPDGICKKRFSKWLPDSDKIIDHKYFFVNLGYNLKPLDLQGSIGKVQLEKFEEIHSKRIISKNSIQKIFEKYIPEVKIVKELPKASTSWFGTPIICKDYEFKQKLVSYLEKNKIQTRNYFAGNILLHPAYKEFDNFKDYPIANKVLDEVFFVGASPHYGEEIFNYFETVLKNFKNEK